MDHLVLVFDRPRGTGGCQDVVFEMWLALQRISPASVSGISLRRSAVGESNSLKYHLSFCETVKIELWQQDDKIARFRRNRGSTDHFAHWDCKAITRGATILISSAYFQ
jgi:hypothetical protein